MEKFKNIWQTILKILYDQGRKSEAEDLPNLVQDLKTQFNFTKVIKDFVEIIALTNRSISIFTYEGDYSKAQERCERALDLSRRLFSDSSHMVVGTMQNLAVIYKNQGKYRQAENILVQALKSAREQQGFERPDGVGFDGVAIILNNLASLYWECGLFSEAETCFQEALELSQKFSRSQYIHMAASLNGLANVYQDRGQYSKAEPLYNQALELMQKNQKKMHPQIMQIIDNMAEMYAEQGRYNEAELLFHKVLNLRKSKLKNEHPAIALNLNNIAMLYNKQKRYSEAEIYCNRALELMRTRNGDHPLVGRIMGNLAVILFASGDDSRVESLCQQALEIAQGQFGDDCLDVANQFNNLAWLYIKQNRCAKAESLFKQAIEVLQRLRGEHQDVASCMTNLAGLLVINNRYSEALELMLQASKIYDRTINEIFATSSESDRLLYLEKIRGDLDLFLSLVIKYLSDSREAVQAAIDVVLKRKALTATAGAAQNQALLSGRYPHLETEFKQLRFLKKEIISLTFSRVQANKPQVYQKRLAELQSEYNQLQRRLASQVPEVKWEQELQNADSYSVTKSIHSGTILVDFIYFNSSDVNAVMRLYYGSQELQKARYFAVVLPAEEPDNTQIIDLGEAKPIDQKIAKFRASITGETARRNFDTVPMQQIPGAIDNGIELRKAIFDPLVKAIGTCQRLFLAPDGDLTRLPFEVLPTDDGNRLIDKYQISYLSTGRDVLRFGAVSTEKSSDPLVVADPDFDLNSAGTKTSEQSYSALGRQSRDLDRSSLRFKRLPGTKVEGEQIAAQLGVKPWMQTEVLESQLKETRSPRILHLATHGFFLENQKRDPHQERLGLATIGEMSRLSAARLENPLLRSGLALAGANTWLQNEKLPPEAEDGILTAEDVSGLDLLDTELVVLSACETGLGEVQTGEGVFGLRRAFVLAGAKTLVMSLWKVPDKQTQELMNDFYRRVLAGQPRADALRDAQLAMKAKYPNPLYWGAFICQGDPSSLLATNSKPKNLNCE